MTIRNEPVRTWSVGALARASGLTIRTLHHWDTRKLLSPSRRSAAGHREYTVADLARLYQILTLRRLGLGLETIASCLDAGVDMAQLVRDHLADIERSIAAFELLRTRLQRIAAELVDTVPLQSSTLLSVIEALDTANPERDQLLHRHLKQTQLDALKDSATAIGPLAHYLLHVEWPQLYRRAAILHTAGCPPTAPEIRQIVARMDELSILFTNGEQDTAAGVRAAWRADPIAMAWENTASATAWAALADYLDQVRQACS